jgi:hypothetical protein
MWQGTMSNDKDFTIALPEWLADVTVLLNIASVRAHCQSSIDQEKTIVWIFDHYRVDVDESNRRLVGDDSMISLRSLS